MWREHLHAATAYGRVCSARVAVELGYGIVADDGPSGRLGHWAIAGIPDAAMELHSKRAAEIDRDVGRAPVRLLPGPGHRRPQDPPREAARAGRGPDGRVGGASWPTLGLDRRRASTPSVADSRDRRITADRSTTRTSSASPRQLLGPGGRLAAEKVFARRDVIVAAAPHLFGLDPAILDRLVDRVLADPDAVALERSRGATEPVWAPGMCRRDRAGHRGPRQPAAPTLAGTAAVVPERLVDVAIEATEARARRTA